MTYQIGYDIGSSSIKIALVETDSGKTVAVINEPQTEMEILSPKKDWAEQDPEMWWSYICQGTKRIIKEATINASKIKGIGIAYQMHGLVIVDEDGNPLRNSIIWCDSRAVALGNRAFTDLGNTYCSKKLLNSPGNFTASKLKWVKENEPDLYSKIHKILLPGDFIAYKFTHELNTTKNGLSEGVFWNFKRKSLADRLLDYYEIEKSLIPDIVENFKGQGNITDKASEETGLPQGIPINYRAGDQPNNALSLNVFNHGEVAATGGTSGVLYAVTDKSEFNEVSKINQFGHANYSDNNPVIGRLLNINGAGIQFRWLKNHLKAGSYTEMNKEAAKVAIGSNGLMVIPFGNGAERMFNNKVIGTHFINLNLNQHKSNHLYRAALEGIAFSFVYGMELLKNDNTEIKVIRAGNDNLFRSEIFGNTIASLTGHDIEIYDVTGAVGAARASSILDGDFKKFGENLTNNDHVKTFKPSAEKDEYIKAYEAWKKELNNIINKD